jgi:Leucine-rich repeat (LRR) protein
MSTPEWIQRKIQNAKQQKLTELDISVSELSSYNDTRINKIPLEVFDLTELEILNLNWHQIQNLPQALNQLTKLKELHLFGLSKSLIF